jgi:hypothetical protein
MLSAAAGVVWCVPIFVLPLMTAPRCLATRSPLCTLGACTRRVNRGILHFGRSVSIARLAASDGGEHRTLSQVVRCAASSLTSVRII